MKRPLILDILRFALNDGPGIRTTIFFKGCPLRCRFCHNPESQLLEQERGNDGTVYGQERTVDEIVDSVLKDKAYYINSGGGVTISGGEPLLFPEFIAEIFKRLQAEGIRTCIDTSGHVPWSAFETVMPYTDLFLYDYKSSDDHQALTGVTSELILQNLERLKATGKDIILRCVLIPGVNDSDEHFKTIVALRLPVHILPFHSTGNHKYLRLNREIPMDRPTATEEEKSAWITRLHAAGLECFMIDNKELRS